MAKLNIKPLNDKVIVKRVTAEDVTSGGIYLPDTAKEKPKRGTVQAVGNGKVLDNGQRSAMQLRKNDEVIFTSYAPEPFKVGDEEYLLMREEDILAVIDE